MISARTALRSSAASALAAGLAVAVVFASSCGGSDGAGDAADARASDASAGADTAATIDGDAPTDGASDARAMLDGGGAVDAGADAAALPACLGASAAMTLNHGLPYTSVAVGNPAATGYFLVDFATTRSTIDLGALPAASAQATGCDPMMLGQACTFPAFDFFGPWGQVTLRTDDESFVTGIAQAGIVGTDFTSDVAVTLDYAHGVARRASSGSLCDDATLSAAGFVALSAAGFFAKDTTQLVPLSNVVADAGAAAGHVPNVPTVPFRVAGSAARAQLDTGFDDALYPFSVNVNQAFFAAISAAAPGALVRNTNEDLVLTTCVGLAENVDAYDLAAGASVAFVDFAGHDAAKTSAAKIFVKNTPAAAASCGGIGTWTVPGAQVGASFFAARAWVFDPDTSRVWMR